MATALTSANQFGRDGVDYSVSHRQPPVPPPQPAPAPHHPPPPHLAAAVASSGAVWPDEPGRPRVRDEAGGVASDGRRRGSFSFLSRTSSLQSSSAAAAGTPPPPPPVPQLPATRTTQAQHSNGNSLGGRHHRVASSSSSTGNREGNAMLRKGSKVRAEQERREHANAASVPQQPPRLPSHHPLPGIASFGGDDTRPDSVAIFNQAYTPNLHAPPLPHQQAHAANFSRPGNAAMPSPTHNSSSSPAYAVRPGNAFAQAQSSPALGGKGRNGGYAAEPTERNESMTNRGRYSYASSTAAVNVSSPRRVRRRKDPTPFNVLFIGAKNSGKTAFISFLRHSLALPPRKQPSSEPDSHVNASKATFTSHYLEAEMDGERVGMTLWDSMGLEKNMVDLQLREMSAFVESKFEETFLEEQKVMRSPGVKDTHIHCVILVLDPVKLDSTITTRLAAGSRGGVSQASAGGLDEEMDLQVIRALWGKTTVIPVISKADTLTVGHMAFLKRSVWESVKSAKLDPLEALELEADEEDDDPDAIAEEDEDEDGEEEEVADGGRKYTDNLDDGSDSGGDTPAPKSRKNATHARHASLTNNSINSDDEAPYIPMSILSPDPYDLPPYTTKSKSTGEKVGRRFPWGFADPYDPEHCDFMRLRDSVFSEWRGDLRDLARTKWYENWRTSRLKNLPGSKQRIKGGVTPVAAVPKEGRTSPKSTRNLFSATTPQSAAIAASSVPRSVAGSTAQTPSGETSSSRADRTRGITAGSEVGSVRGGTYRGLESYQ